MCPRSRRGTGANSLGQSALTNASHIGNHNSAQVLVLRSSLYIAAFICTYLTKQNHLAKSLSVMKNYYGHLEVEVYIKK